MPSSAWKKDVCSRSEEHTSELQSLTNIGCRLLLEKNEHTPKSMGFYMPAEWERQEAIWLSWPHNSEWWGKEISEVEQSFGQFAQALYTGQEVRILVPD